MRAQTKGLLLWAGAVVAYVAFGFLACRRWEREKEQTRQATQQSQQTKTRIAMKWKFAGTMAPYFAAKKNGVFDAQKLDVDLIEAGPGSPSSVQQVLLRRAQYGITGAHELALARSQDQPLRALAVIFKVSPTCLLSLPQAAIKHPRDFKGKTVEMTSNDNSDFEFRAMLRKHGVAPETVKFVPFTFVYDRLYSGQTQAAVAYANDQAITESRSHPDLAIHVLSPSDYGVTPYADVLFAMEDQIEKDPDTTGRITVAILEAWEWAALHTEQTVDNFLEAPQIRALGLDRETQVAVLSRSIEFVRGARGRPSAGSHIEDIGLQTKERWQETIDLLRDYGSVAKLPQAESCFTNRWVELHRATGHPSAR